MRYSGHCPRKWKGTFRPSRARCRPSSTDGGISNDRQRRLMLEKTLKELEGAPPPDRRRQFHHQRQLPDSPTSEHYRADARGRQAIAGGEGQHYSDTWPDVSDRRVWMSFGGSSMPVLERPVSVSEPRRHWRPRSHPAGILPPPGRFYARSQIAMGDRNG
jgi:hypothetical protein